jgi:peptidyl-dipeptidase Dcp
MLDNPLLQPWSTLHGLPPFDRIHPEHIEPALEHAIAEHRRELAAIVAQPAAPTFDDTIAAFDRAGRLLRRVTLVLDNLAASETSPALQAVERALAPRIAAHQAAIYTDAALFARVDALFARRDELALDPEERRLLERVHLDFELQGARLVGVDRERYVAIVTRLAELGTRFEQNVLADEANWRCVLAERQLAGLPAFLIDALRSAARERGLPEGTHAVVLSRSIVRAFLSFCRDRTLREEVWRAWTSRGAHEGAHDNRPIAKEILALRAELARLRGKQSYAEAALVDRMAKRPSAVLDLLGRVWEPAKEAAAKDRALLLELARADGIDALAPWDWRYYAERVRETRFEVDDAEVKKHFALEDMRAAMFYCAERLFGLSFREITGSVALYHPDVRAYEVRRGEDVIGVLLADDHARPSKRGGAWMHNYRRQWREPSGERVAPIVVNNNNFAKGSPTLLSFDDVRTLFHEFGHGLHGLLSDVRFETISGTEVLQDYVELPSQLFEHWAEEREVLGRFARHVETREPISDALLAKVQKAREFDQAHGTLQYVGSALIDMALHARADVDGVDIEAFEAAERARLGVPEDVGLMHRLPHFRHIFSSSAYAAGYYVYMWAEVLDADAFEAFVETGDPFHPETAERLLRYVYAAGGSMDPAEAYRAFRGRDPKVEPMLRKRGLLA